MKQFLKLTSLLLVTVAVFCSCNLTKTENKQNTSISLDSIPEFTDKPYVEINDNKATFGEDELSLTSFEMYYELDSLSRCTGALSCVGEDLMPTEERGQIGQVKPTGWHLVKYDCVDGKYLYNRCHLLAYQLTAENANEKNLITGTRYLNVTGMLPFENMVAEYVKDTHNHVLYSVTPIFEGDNLVASGVHMMAESCEDNGKAINFNVYCYNVQPGVTIDYLTGESRLDTETETVKKTTNSSQKYLINKNTKKVHLPDCDKVKDILPKNKKETTENLDVLLKQGYSACKSCLG